jgi:hypothetical protein
MLRFRHSGFGLGSRFVVGPYDRAEGQLGQ